MIRTLVVLRKGAVITSVFACGYYLGFKHAMTEPDEVKFRRVRKEIMADVEKRRRERLIKRYKR